MDTDVDIPLADFRKWEVNLDIMVSTFLLFNISYLNVQSKHHFDQNYMHFINLLKIIFIKSALNKGH